MELMQDISNKFPLFKWFKPSHFSDSILKRILNSKRLLADHIELLEHCQATQIDHIECSSTTNYKFHLANGMVLTVLAVASYKTYLKCLRILVPTAVTTYGLYMLIITIGKLKKRLTQYRLDDTLVSIDMADAGIRKNISFLRESKILTDPAISKWSCNQTNICLKSIAEISRHLYNEVKRLESIQLPIDVESMYEPLEEITTCIYFQRNIEEFSYDDIKTFYNIFLYFQSQFLTRLCLIIHYAEYIALRYINEGCTELRKNLRINIKQLDIRLTENLRQKQRTHLNRQQTGDNNTDSIVPTDVFKMKRSSIDVLCRLIAIVNQYQNTDDHIQAIDMHTDKQHLTLVLNEMIRINESLCACQEDFETLKLIYRKCLLKNVDLPIEMARQPKINESTSDEVNIASDSNVKNHVEEESKEYFAMRNNKNDDEDSDNSDDNENGGMTKEKWYDELDHIDVKLTRSFFAPVLKQLKTKIDPIKEEMKERELKYLMSKGFDREEIMKFDSVDSKRNNSSDDESGEHSIVGDHVKAKSKHQAHRFDEMRAFLEQKQQIHFLPLQNLPPPCGSEDVIE